MTFLTHEGIVAAEVSKLNTKDITALKALSESDIGRLHHGYGTHIRNMYLLWDRQNPLTAQWFKDCDEAPDREHQYMEEGVDCHPLHPDQVSFEIIKDVWRHALKR